MYIFLHPASKICYSELEVIEVAEVIEREKQRRALTMDKYIPYEKRSKKQKKADDKKRRVTWAISPVTRNAQNPNVYNRQKARKWNQDDFPTVLIILANEFNCRL